MAVVAPAVVAAAASAYSAKQKQRAANPIPRLPTPPPKPLRQVDAEAMVELAKAVKLARKRVNSDTD